MLKEVVDFGKKFVIDKSEAKIDSFRVGDTVTVGLKIVDGSVVRVQDFTGTCIAIRKKGVGTNFIVRKIVGETAIERNVMMYSPLVAYVKLIRSGKVRRAKLYYMRNLRGKAARIKERVTVDAKITKKAKGKTKTLDIDGNDNTIENNIKNSDNNVLGVKESDIEENKKSDKKEKGNRKAGKTEK